MLIRAQHGAGALPLALLLSFSIASGVLHAFPYRPHAIDPAPAVHTVHVCLPGKDQSRHVNTGLLPVHGVKTISYVAADFAPRVQAQETRGKRKKRH